MTRQQRGDGAAVETRYLSRDAILGVRDLRTEEVYVPEWEGTVLVQGMTGTQRDRFEAEVLRLSPEGKRMGLNLDSMRAKLVARCIVDDEGQRLFSDADIEVLGGKSSQAIDRVYAVAARLSGIGPGDVEELSQGLEPGQSEPSTSS